MMKQSILLSLFILVHIPIFGMSNEHETIPCDRCGLGNIVYNVVKRIGRNDFLYLAHANSVWCLRKKLQLKEQFENRDRYYIRLGRFVNGTEISLYHTPLHEAVKQGHIETVKLLCAVGADAHKKIKSALELRPEEEAATESHPATYISSRGEVDTEIKEFNARFHIGLSAIELAKVMRTESEDKPSERTEIERFLMEYGKKD